MPFRQQRGRNSGLGSGPLPAFVQLPLDEAVQNLAALRAITAGVSGYTDQQGRYVEDELAIYWFDAGFGAAVADDGRDIIRPTDILLAAAGRWRRYDPVKFNSTAVNFAASPYTVLATDDALIVDAGAGAITINLPAVAAAARQFIYVKATDVSGGAVTIDANLAETIDGLLTLVLDETNEDAILYCNGTSWHVFGTESQLNSTAVNFAASPYTVVAADDVLVVTAAGGAVTINLPAVATSARRLLQIKATDVSGGNVTVDANLAETIDGALTQVMAVQFQSLSLYCDGTVWHIL